MDARADHRDGARDQGGGGGGSGRGLSLGLKESFVAICGYVLGFFFGV